MPKYPVDKRRYYDEMSDPGRARSRTYARGKPQDDNRREEPYSDRPRHPSSRPGPSGESSRPSTSAVGGYPSSARGEQHRSSEYGRPSSTITPPDSETASTTGSIGGGDSGAVSRGAMRGRRVLPTNIITRPRHVTCKQGATGEPIKLEANYFRLLSATDWRIYQYRVDYAPEEDRNVVKKSLLRSHSETIGPYIFDGSILYTSQRLEDPLSLISIRNQDQQEMIITIRNVGEMTRGDHHYIQFFNIIMRKCLDYLKLQLVGRNYFDPQNKSVVRDHGLELWPGYITSIRQHENDILLCSEIAHKVMRQQTLLDILIDCHKRNRNEYRNLFGNMVIGTVVLTDYNNATYKVDDIDWEKNPLHEFEAKGKTTTLVKYYNDKYDRKINDFKQPLLVSRAKARDLRAGKDENILLVPELCRSTGLTDSMRQNFQLMSALSKYTRVGPADRIAKLRKFNDRLMGVPNVVTELKNWNLRLDQELVKVPARVLPAEDIYFNNSVKVKVGPKSQWQTEMRDKVLYQTGSLTDWVVIVPSHLKSNCAGFVSALMRVAGNMGFHIDHPMVYDIRDDGPASYASLLEEVCSRENPALIFCVVSNNRLDRYSAIKKKTCIERPVPTQVIVAKNLQPGKGQMSIATKVAIQMNCKIGGIPWAVSIPLKGLMVVGFDVCHDPGKKGRDFGAFVASISGDFGRYYSAVSSHCDGTELSHDLSANMCKALNEFKKHNFSYPKRIIVYRDGVGEGQVHHVVEHEVDKVKKSLATVYDSPDDIKLAYIIVTKKINTRFFHRGRENPPAGTIVDDIVTDPSRYDFFIIAQHVTQGTVTPTSYNIIEDSVGLDTDKIQRLTYKLCHMYFNWSGTVRVPAPCQYAHKLAFLVSQAVRQAPSTRLETLLYFL